jgi:glycosyltransferase involved in cell wall biosynthesis
MKIYDGHYECDVTVLMPVYNGADYLSKAIESVLLQDNVSIRLIVFNDGSTDSTSRILSKFTNKNVTVLTSEKNVGYVPALNQMLSYVRSPYIARLDADDIAKPNRLSKQLAYIEGKPDTLVLGSDFEYIDTQGVTLDYGTDRCSGMTPNIALLFQNVICHPTTLIRTTVFRDVTSGYDSDIMPAEDYDLWLKCSEVGDVEIYPEKLTRYRLHAKQVTGMMSKSTYRKNSIIRMRHLGRIEARPLKCQTYGTLNRVARIVDFEAEKYSLDIDTKYKLFIRYLQDICISDGLPTREQAWKFVIAILRNTAVTRSDKIVLLRCARRSLFS